MESNKEEIHNFLVKAVEDNIDKFEWDKEDKRKLVYEDLVITSEQKQKNTQFGFRYYFEITIKYKNLKYSYEKYAQNYSELFERVLESVRNRAEKELKIQQEQDLKELKKLCKNS